MKVHSNTNDDLIPEENIEMGRIVTIFLTTYKSGTKRNFRCISCGKLLFQYESENPLVIDRETSPEDTPSNEHLCHRCKVLYKVLFL